MTKKKGYFCLRGSHLSVLVVQGGQVVHQLHLDLQEIVHQLLYLPSGQSLQGSQEVQEDQEYTGLQ